MTEFRMNSPYGVFDPPAARDLVEAFEKADRHLDRLRSSTLGELDRDRVARKIVLEARTGETQPDLVWRVAVAKVLLEAGAVSSKADKEPRVNAPARPMRKRRSEPMDPAAMPPAGPHATPRQTNPEATPGAGALPCELPGDDVDPATG